MNLVFSLNCSYINIVFFGGKDFLLICFQHFSNFASKIFIKTRVFSLFEGVAKI